MNVGTKSLLWGVHQFAFHPVTVLLAWRELYGTWPNWKEMVCIIIHDWGYWGSPNMDGEEGEMHPIFAADLASDYLDQDPEIEWSLGGCDPMNNDCFKRDPDYRDRVVTRKTDNTYANLCLFHSRHFAKRNNQLPSKLCWADKLSIKYDPWWLYLSRAWLSGELDEYRALHGSMGENFQTHREWYNWASERAIRMGKAQSSEGISFHPDPRGKQ